MPITRRQYLNDTSLHRAYFDQAVTPEVMRVVTEHIGEARIKASTDLAFNDIPLAQWDALRPYLEGAMTRFCRLVEDYPAGVSLGTAVCIAKAAARQIRGDQIEGEPK